MIGRLRGTLLYKRPPAMMLEVNGIGYELEAPLSVFFSLPEPGGEVTLYTHLAVREDAQTLYAFAEEPDKVLFRTLLKVSGIGAKMGLAILSGMNREEFARCVELEDVGSLVRVPGIGKKTAQRLIVEMRDRLELSPISDPSRGADSANAVKGLQSVQSPRNEAVEALITLGYRPQEATRMIGAVEGEGASSEELIRSALKYSVRQEE